MACRPSLFESFPELTGGSFLATAATVLRVGGPRREAELTLRADDAPLTLSDVGLVRVGTLLALSWAHARS